LAVADEDHTIFGHPIFGISISAY